MANGTVNKIDVDQLDTYIEQLKVLKTNSDITYNRSVDLGNNSGITINRAEEILKEYQNLEDAFVRLLDNTISYMTNRKNSVENMENVSESKVSE